MTAPLRFALVPKKETPEMVLAFNGYEISFFDDAYPAMLAASPGNDLLERIVRARDAVHASVREARQEQLIQSMLDLVSILDELGGGDSQQEPPAPVPYDGTVSFSVAFAIAKSHARLLEALVKIERRTFQHSDDDAADHRRNLYHAHSIARQAIAAAQPFTET